MIEPCRVSCGFVEERFGEKDVVLGCGNKKWPLRRRNQRASNALKTEAASGKCFIKSTVDLSRIYGNDIPLLLAEVFSSQPSE